MIHNGRVSNFNPLPAQRLLLVHAHPDDETINNGTTMAGYRARGVAVTLVTCTRGEEGEVLIPSLAHHSAARENTLGTYREGELEAAMKELGVTDFEFLGASERQYRDSGMMGTPANLSADCLWQAPLDDAARRLAAIIRERKPQVLITYDEFCGYGHPDHIKAHQIAMRAAELAADADFLNGEPWEISKIYWSAIPRSALQGSLTSSNVFIQILIKFFNYLPSKWIALPFVKADSEVTSKFDGEAFLPVKLLALKAHKTQLVIEGDSFKFSKRLATRVNGTEFYTRVKGEAVGPYDEHGRELDLFAGIKE